MFPNQTSADGASSRSSQKNNIFPVWFEEESRRGEEDQKTRQKLEGRAEQMLTALGVERKEMRSVKDGAMRTV
jgi:hypothetical protein